MLRRTVLAIAIVATLAGAVAAQYLMALPERDPPTFDQSTPLNINAAENQTAVTTVSATGEGTITYSLSGTDDEYFSIGSSTGVITFNSAPNYENPLDADFNNVYTFTANASNGSVSSITVNVTVTDESEGSPEAPTIVNANPLNVNVQEGATTIATITATGDAPLTYSVSGTDADDVSIGSSSGVLVFDPAPDYEIPTDSNTDNLYTFTVTASNGVSPDDSITVNATVTDYDESFPTLTNIDTLQAAGWDVPDETTWWIVHPTAAEIKASLKTPFLNDPGGDGICIKRFFIPDTFVSGQYDLTQMNAIGAPSNSMHRQSLRAWFELQILADSADYTTMMGNAKSTFNSELDTKLAAFVDPHVSPPGSLGLEFASNVGVAIGTRNELAAVLALDWIVWDDAAEFEAAFDKVKTLIENNINYFEYDGRNFRSSADEPGATGEGYVNASHVGSTTAYWLEAMLALGVHGVNPSGASHAWADNIIDHMGDDPSTDTQAVWSPFQMANMLNLLSLGNGGGREYGRSEPGTAMGGYELNFAVGALFALWGTDTATDSEWSLVDKSLYLNTRTTGLVTEADKTVNKATVMHSGCQGFVAACANLFGDTTTGRTYKWIQDRHTEAGNLRVFRAIAGPPPTALAPSGEFADRVGCRWCYREDLSVPDSTFRVNIGYHSIDNWRETGDDRILGFAIGSVGLVDGECNRGHPNAVVANGPWVGYKSAEGDPIFCKTDWWTYNSAIIPYLSGLRSGMPQPVAQDSDYIRGSQTKPVRIGDVFTWTRDRSSFVGVSEIGSNGASANALFTGSVSDYELDVANKVLTVTDTITVDLSTGLYLGWHFSCSHEPTTITNGFEFTDGTDVIRVTVVPNGAFGLTRTILTDDIDTTPFDLGSYEKELEYWKTVNSGTNIHKTRIDANVRFVPDTVLGGGSPADYEVTVTIEANP